ncbi:MAG: right-handed parallel beta-helix repeat-containing protein [Eubacterium sp.]|nr:right-handed parallel beta-helix repeat-containing protein [Eubacterium sp.]
MQVYVSASAVRSGCGSKDAPFKTINEAAQIAEPGDEVLVAPGIYREYVCPAHAGTEKDRIVYRSIEPLAAVITGAEQIKKWDLFDGDTWLARIPNGLFGEYNPYIETLRGDWYLQLWPAHTGEVYLNGRSMYEVASLKEVLNPQILRKSWDPEGTKYQWFTEQEDGVTLIYANFRGIDPNQENVEINVRRNCFYPDRSGVDYITVSGFTIRQAATQWAPPTAYQDGMIGPRWSKGWVIEDCEISDSKCSGISLGKYLQPDNENKWSTGFIKDGAQNERDAICLALIEGWTKENIGSHIVRRCNIHDCGQAGIVGHLGGVFSTIEDNHIHHINNKQDINGAENAGIKMHAAIDVVFRRNHIHHCTRGLWLDWQAQGTRVTGNLFHDNTPPDGTEITMELAIGEDLFIEVSHGPTLVDNNLLLSDVACRLSTQGLAFVHNLIAGSFTFVGEGVDSGGKRFTNMRYTPYHLPHRTEILGFMSILHGDTRFYNNIFLQKPIRPLLTEGAKKLGLDRISAMNFACGTFPYDGYPDEESYLAQFAAESFMSLDGRDKYYDHLPMYFGGNVYCNGAKPSDGDEDACTIQQDIELSLTESDGAPVLKTNLYEYLRPSSTGIISTALLGQAFEPEQRFEKPDGTAIVFDTDYLGAHREVLPLAGPFAASPGDTALF